MNHEPECQHYVEEAETIRTGACIFCGIARAAYRRGREDEKAAWMSLKQIAAWLAAHDAEVYQRGREDAANAVGLLGSWLDETVDFGDAIAAARGVGEPTVIRSPVVEKLENFKPLFADTQYGRIYFKGSCTHTRTQYTREICWCGDAVDVCEDCGIDVHECGLDGEK